MERVIATGIVLSGLMMVKAGYTYGTTFNKKITVEDKFERVTGDKSSTSQVFCVSTKDGEVYHVRKSLWYWQFYSTELWSNLKKEKTYEIKAYGWRIGMLSIYPNIVDVKEIE